jgi:hypothetical protein
MRFGSASFSGYYLGRDVGGGGGAVAPWLALTSLGEDAGGSSSSAGLLPGGVPIQRAARCSEGGLAVYP